MYLIDAVSTHARLRTRTTSYLTPRCVSIYLNVYNLWHKLEMREKKLMRKLGKGNERKLKQKSLKGRKFIDNSSEEGVIWGSEIIWWLSVGERNEDNLFMDQFWLHQFSLSPTGLLTFSFIKVRQKIGWFWRENWKLAENWWISRNTT